MGSDNRHEKQGSGGPLDGGVGDVSLPWTKPSQETAFTRTPPFRKWSLMCSSQLASRLLTVGPFLETRRGMLTG